MPLKNWEVAAILTRIGQLLALQEDKPFKSRAYARAARSIQRLDEDVEAYHRKGALTRIAGVGRNIGDKIREILETGESSYLKKLEARFPGDFLDVLAVPGVGLATGRLLYRHLNVASLKDVERAVANREVRKIPGLGPKTEQRLKEGLRLMQDSPKVFNLGFIAPLAREIELNLNSLDFVEQAAAGGGFRRRAEAVSSLDFVISSREREKVAPYLEKQPFIREVRAKGQVIEALSLWQLPLSFHLVKPEDFWSSLLWVTGSKDHLDELAALAASGGLEISREIFQEGEGEFYRRLGCPWIPPELREGRGEVEAALKGELPSLVSLADIRGDLHTHSSWSDGTESIRNMALKAREKGYSYMAVTDHSQSLKIAGGLTPGELEQQVREINRLKEDFSGFTILTGMEVDIKKDGTLDLPDSVMEGLDLVVASIHTGFKQPGEQLTRRMMAAMENPHVDIIGHPTGRLIGRRAPYPVDVDAILNKAAETGKVLEINASPDRLDLKDVYVQKGRELGVKFAVNTDTHSAVGLNDMEFGVAAARRGWLEAEDVINTYDIDRLKSVLNKGGRH